MEKKTETLLLIFVKNPDQGKVKTRLAESIGDAKALNVYHQLLNITRDIAAQVPCKRQLWYSSFIDEDDCWPSAEFEKRLQHGENLGYRMRYAFEHAFEEGYQEAVIIGSDCPDLTVKIIQRAYHELQNHDIVIGPSQDGGYYLLGMSSFQPELFEIEKWSTSSVCEETMQHARRLGLSFSKLPTLNDVDTLEDLKGADKNIDY